MKIILLVCVYAIFSLAQSERSEDYITVKGDVIISNDMQGEKIILVQPSPDTIQCEMFASLDSQFSNIQAENGAIVNNIKVMTLQPRTSDSIVIQGSVSISGETIFGDECQPASGDEISQDVQNEEQQYIFIETSKIQINGVPQWTLLQSESFNFVLEEELFPLNNGWSQEIIEENQMKIDDSQIQGKQMGIQEVDQSSEQNTYNSKNEQISSKKQERKQQNQYDEQREDNRGAEEQEENDEIEQQEFYLQQDGDPFIFGLQGEVIYQNFTNLPNHQYLQIDSNFFFISQVWNGEAAFIEIDGRIVWMDTHDWGDEDPDVGGNDQNKKLQQLDLHKKANNEQKNEQMDQFGNQCDLNINISQDVWTYPISLVIKHSKNHAFIQFGINQRIKDLVCYDENNQTFKKLPLFGFDDFSIFIK